MFISDIQRALGLHTWEDSTDQDLGISVIDQYTNWTQEANNICLE